MIEPTVDLDAIVVKVQKLLALGTSSNPNEAQAAVQKAQDLLAKYDLTMDSVTDLKADPRTAVRQGGVASTATEGKPESWKSDLLEAVARAFECKVTWSHEYTETRTGRYREVKSGMLIGFGHDVEAAGYAQSFLVGEITRLAKEYSRTHWDAIAQLAEEMGWAHGQAESFYSGNSGTHPLKAELYFIKGATETVREALERDAWERRRAATAQNPNALVVQKESAIRDFIYQERYGMSYADWRAKWDAEMAARKAAEEPTEASTSALTKEPSPSTRRRAEEAAERRRRRADERYWREQERERKATDHSALRAGQEAGRTIRIRPGVEPGVRPHHEIA